MKADLLFHHPNPFIDDMLHDDVVERDEDGNEVIHPGTPDREVVVIEPEPEPDPAPETDPAPEPDSDSDTALIGGTGNDRLVAGHNDNLQVIVGGSGNDYLESASSGDFTLMDGGPGNDTLVARGDFNVMIGGSGRDVFDISRADTSRIMDFESGFDRIKITDYADHDLYRFYQAVSDAGIQFRWDWVADLRVEGPGETAGFVLQLREEDISVTVVGADFSQLVLEIVGDDLFIA